MKILITNFYSQSNSGDAAILASLIFEFRRVFEQPELTISTIDQSNLSKTFEGAPYIYSMIDADFIEVSNRFSKLVNLLKSWLFTSLWSIICRVNKKRFNWLLKKTESKILNELADSDLVVAVGGGYIRGRSGLIKIIDLALVLQILCLSRLLGKKTV